jgi:hypothetical protein
LLGEPEDAVADALDVLVDAHVLESPAPDRYRFHDLLRVYAADRARTQETESVREAAITRVLAWYLRTAEAAATVISPQHTRVPLEPPPDPVQPVRFLGLDQVPEAIRYLEESVDIRESIGERYAQAATLQALGRAQQRAGNPGLARELTIRALRLAEEVRDQQHEADLARLTRADHVK